MQELVDGTRCRGECHRRYDLASASDGAEDQICAAGVEGEHDTRVFHTSSGRLPPALAVIDHVASLPHPGTCPHRSPTYSRVSTMATTAGPASSQKVAGRPSPSIRGRKVMATMRSTVQSESVATPKAVPHTLRGWISDVMSQAMGPRLTAKAATWAARLPA